MAAAERAAHRVRSVRAVANDIEVRLPSAAERTDADVAAAVARALEWGRTRPGREGRRDCSRGWVTLHGEVEWEHQKPTPSPADLKRRIEDALPRSAETDARRITVEVQGDRSS